MTAVGATPPIGALPPAETLLAVCAHPDDESFGLGAILSAYDEHGTRVRVVCFTSGEASTLGTSARPLAEVRREELTKAGSALGVDEVAMFNFPDGHLSDVPLSELACRAHDSAGDVDLVLVFDEGGITGHPDHCRATEAGILMATWRQLRVLAWALPISVADQLNAEFATSFVGRLDSELSIVVSVDRSRQRRAIACHASQSQENPVLSRRLELLGDSEYLRQLA
ncbi:MAG: PIG-L deacetylase family protein [Acidimicrobiales bacterium]